MKIRIWQATNKYAGKWMWEILEKEADFGIKWHYHVSIIATLRYKQRLERNKGVGSRGYIGEIEFQGEGTPCAEFIYKAVVCWSTGETAKRLYS